MKDQGLSYKLIVVCDIYQKSLFRSHCTVKESAEPSSRFETLKYFLLFKIKSWCKIIFHIFIPLDFIFLLLLTRRRDQFPCHRKSIKASIPASATSSNSFCLNRRHMKNLESSATKNILSATNLALREGVKKEWEKYGLLRYLGGVVKKPYYIFLGLKRIKMALYCQKNINSF